MGKFSKLLGFSAPKVKTEAPKDLETDAAKANKSKRNQFMTEGQVAGIELNPEQVGGRNSIFGN